MQGLSLILRINRSLKAKSLPTLKEESQSATNTEDLNLLSV